MISLSPYITQDKAPGELQDLIVEIYSRDRALNDSIPPALRKPMEYLLRMVNSYYSNKIEGNPTLPSEVLHLQEENGDREVDDDLMEIKQHLEVQCKIAFGEIERNKVSSRDFLSEVHKAFYEGLPEKFRYIEHPETKEKIAITPGECRKRGVKVGKHTPPDHEELDRYLRWFEQMYQPDQMHGLNRMLAAAAAHHRFAWIHPFMDGNGRVGRIFTDAHMKQSGLSGYGLWSMSRGFARDTDAYYAALKQADLKRKGDLDGRGLLSEKGLLKYTEYFLKTALDQVTYFASLLQMDHLRTRVDYYFDMRAKGALPRDDGTMLPPLRPEAKEVYRMLMNDGPMSRTSIREAIGLGERTFQKLLVQMADERLVIAPHKQPIELALSPESIGILFPKLW